jgi:hypothetical protein
LARRGFPFLNYLELYVSLIDQVEVTVKVSVDTQLVFIGAFAIVVFFAFTITNTVAACDGVV